jgi:hypothetical protein
MRKTLASSSFFSVRGRFSRWRLGHGGGTLAPKFISHYEQIGLVVEAAAGDTI